MKPLILGTIIDRSSKELKKSGSDSPSLDVYLLLENALDKKRVFILSHTDFPVSNPEYYKFRKLLNRRKKGEPVAYILSRKEFYGYGFFVNKNVLIPRPETEWLVEQAIDFVGRRLASPVGGSSACLAGHVCRQAGRRVVGRLNILDIGTGSGCIIISIAEELNKLTRLQAYKLIRFFASDISKKSLYVAKKNAKKYGLNNIIRFYHSDLFKNKRMPKKYDLIIANLPYVPDDKTNQKLIFEPQNAIYSAQNGTKIIKEFLNQSLKRINIEGVILIELDPRNANDILNYAKKLFINYNIELKNDLAGLKRYLTLSQKC